ncbi:hypothetical protein [Leifsonia shinshuensis]|uniref:hypothetical protein n=1 Tax=Leifsonia shinshuensis TaxID=150026 RepID=UPI00285BACCD|nr:hypothetical protein [Leifsonia shinshuensis]MDR6970842.1 hypothetical protein [Leifsonia shinshuensis]
MTTRDEWRIALIGFAGTVIGAVSVLAGTVISSNLQDVHDRTAKLEQQREKLFDELLDYGNDYGWASIAAQNYLEAGHTDQELLGNEALMSRYLKARHDFKTSVNQMSVYGTSDAWQRAEELYKALPPIGGDKYVYTFNYGEYDLAYGGVLSEYCQEAQPDRKDCDSR